MENNWNQLASEEMIEKTSAALKENGINVIVVSSGKEALSEALKLIPKRAEVLVVTSITADSIGLTEIINKSGNYDSVKPKLAAMDRNTQMLKMQKLGAAPEYVTGSVHAISEDGHVFIASNTGSQLASYVYGASHVIWVVSTKKIVKNFDQALKRIHEYSLPLEAERARKAYGVAGSNVSKLLIINKEINPNRITVIFVKEDLGF